MRAFLQYIFIQPYYFLTKRNYRTFLWLLFRHGSKRRFIPFSTRVNGYAFSLPDAPSFVWQYKEIFVDESYMFQNSNESPLILDCGANVGSSCIWFKQFYPKANIIAFEADANVAGYLNKNLSANKVTGVTVINKAVWVHNDTISFSSEGADGGSIVGENKSTQVQIPAIRLKDQLMEHNSIDLLKMDIEGAEYDVLKDCDETLKRVKNIFVEYHDFHNAPQNLSAILQLLEKNNFTYWVASVHHRKHPLMNHPQKGNMNLQLNIYARNRTVN